MENVNRFLILSLNQDLRMLDRVCKEIAANIETKNQIKSWLFPTRFSAEVEVDGDVYVRCLELLVDRTHYFFNLLNKYIDHSKNKNNIKTASTVTLGTAVALIWKNIQIIPTVNKSMGETESCKNSKQTQTEEISRNRCDSCGFAVLCIKSLYRKIQTVVDTVEDKEETIFNITQAGCMNRITGVIEETFDRICLDYKAKCEKLEDTQKLLAKYSEELETLQKLKNDYEDVVQIKNHFYRNILRKKQLLDELTEQQNKIKDKNKKLMADNETLREEKFLLCTEKDLWKKHFENVKTEQEQLKFQCEHLKMKLCKIERELDGFMGVVDNMEIKIVNIETTREIYKELHCRIEEIYCLIAKNKNETSNDDCVAGDPLKDMKSEIDHNNAVIERLSGRNKKLLTVMSRLHALKNR